MNNILTCDIGLEHTGIAILFCKKIIILQLDRFNRPIFDYITCILDLVNKYQIKTFVLETFTTNQWQKNKEDVVSQMVGIIKMKLNDMKVELVLQTPKKCIRKEALQEEKWVYKQNNRWFLNDGTKISSKHIFDALNHLFYYVSQQGFIPHQVIE